MARTRTVVMSTRVTPAERAIIEAAAALRGVSVAELLWRLVAPTAHAIVAGSAPATRETSTERPS